MSISFPHQKVESFLLRDEWPGPGQLKDKFVLSVGLPGRVHATGLLLT